MTNNPNSIESLLYAYDAEIAKELDTILDTIKAISVKLDQLTIVVETLKKEIER